MRKLRTILRSRRIRRACAAIVCVPVVILCAFHACVWLLPFPTALSAQKPAATWISDRSGNAIAACVAADDQWRLPLCEDEISPHLLRAIVAVEDARFFDHNGVDWRSVAGSAWENVTSFRTRRGASTLSMQLVRLREPSSRNLPAKFFQAVRAEQLEQRLAKSQILLAYLNEAPFGGNLVGAGAASWRYFAKPCSQLSLAEAALLAGLPQNPNRLRPDRFAERAKARRDHILSRMHALSMISDANYRQAIEEPLHVAWHPLPQMRNDGSLPTLLRLAELYRGQKLQLTIDPVAQRTADELTREHLERPSASNIHAAAVVVLDTETAEVLAAVSCAQGRSQLDLTTSPRSTGSTLKPFIYAAAVDAGILSMSSKLDDNLKAWASYVPANYDRSFRGELSASEALAESRNIPAMTVLSRVGVARTINVLGACGIRSVALSPQRYGLPLAIGGAEASPLEIAEAYATLARGGIHRSLRWTMNPPSQPSTVLSRDACLQVLAAIADPHRTSRLSTEAARLQVAWKTGTSSGHRDAWCAAVTPRRTVVVWLGNEKGEGSNALVGVDAAAPLALRLIAAIDPGGKGFDVPATCDRTVAVAQIARPKLAILSPSNGEQLVLDQDASAVVSLKAHSTRGDETLYWFVDGNAVDGTRWTPTPGSHELRVVDAKGASAVATIVVRGN